MTATYHKLWLGVLLILIAAALSACGGLLWKISAGEVNLYLLGGYALQALGALFMTVGFKYGKLAVLHPVLSFNYILVVVFSALILHETVSLPQIVGVAAIVVGIVLLTKEKRGEK